MVKPLVIDNTTVRFSKENYIIDTPRIIIIINTTLTNNNILYFKPVTVSQLVGGTKFRGEGKECGLTTKNYN